ncbi:hypothetical protein HBB16_06625 [Pseudonocardia sp. MCCB 268]|nr:hypothetical protein [Pseudonocardia cytotoxica]
MTRLFAERGSAGTSLQDIAGRHGDHPPRVSTTTCAAAGRAAGQARHRGHRGPAGRHRPVRRTARTRPGGEAVRDGRGVRRRQTRQPERFRAAGSAWRPSAEEFRAAAHAESRRAVLRAVSGVIDEGGAGCFLAGGPADRGPGRARHVQLSPGGSTPAGATTPACGRDELADMAAGALQRAPDRVPDGDSARRGALPFRQDLTTSNGSSTAEPDLTDRPSAPVVRGGRVSALRVSSDPSNN